MKVSTQDLVVKQLINDLNHYKSEAEEKDAIIRDMMETIEFQQELIEELEESEDKDIEEIKKRIVHLRESLKFAEKIAGL